MADDKARFTLRIPQALYSKVKTSAENNKRSVIKEIEFILEQYFSSQNDAKKSSE